MYQDRYDVVVAGGGPSGTAAGIAAAKNGAKVLLIERCGFLGGMMTNASLPVFCPFSDGEKAVIRGIGLEILDEHRSQAWKCPVEEKDNGIPGLDWAAIDPEILKRILDRKVQESGCEILLHTNVIGVEMEEKEIRAVTIHNKGGIRRIFGKIFIDCTGDADLVASAGGSYEFGDENGMVQAVTLCFRLANVDGERFLRYKQKEGETGNLSLAVGRARENGEFPFDEVHVATFALQDNSMAGVNFGHAYAVNPLDAWDLTRAEIESRRKIPALMSFLRKYVPGLEQAVLAASGPYVGIRESRRILGEYRLTREDYAARARFPDQIARYAYPIDIHASTPEGLVTKAEQDEYVTSRYRQGESYGIPFRALLPRGLENVMAAGRTISADRAMNASCRVTPACFATGQAAGTAAALCVAQKTALRDLETERLRTLLWEQGAYL